MKFLEFFFDIKNVSADKSEILIAQLFDLGFDSFEESDLYLKAYILEEKITKILIKRLKRDLIVKDIIFYSSTLLEKNWNNIWESNFSPIYFESGMIRAPFHKKNNLFKYDVIINPKMSFGTGHHETTKLMIDSMLKLDNNPKDQSVVQIDLTNPIAPGGSLVLRTEFISKLPRTIARVGFAENNFHFFQ